MRNTSLIAAGAGFPNVISFSGNRRGIPDDVGIENAVEALKKIVGHAEKKKITIFLEYLNSKVDHKDYMFDNIAWGIEVCRRVGSDRVKILYDIYHAQIMEGDIIRTLRASKDYIGHYHTGGPSVFRTHARPSDWPPPETHVHVKKWSFSAIQTPGTLL